MAKLLLTGFDAFGGHATNPTAQLAARLKGCRIAEFEVRTAVLPVTFAGAGQRLLELLRAERPDLVLCTGQAAGRPAISLERVALNVIDAEQPDNAGQKPTDLPVEPAAPAAYFSTLPIKDMLEALRSRNIPAEISNSAGTYVCNAVFFRLMHRLRRRPGVAGGFVHVPCTPDQVAASGPGSRPSMQLAEIEQALRICIEVASARFSARELGRGF